MGLSSIALFTTQNGLPLVRVREEGKGRREKKGKGREGKGRSDCHKVCSELFPEQISQPTIGRNGPYSDSFSALKTTSGKSSNLAGVTHSPCSTCPGKQHLPLEKAESGKAGPGRQAPSRLWTITCRHATLQSASVTTRLFGLALAPTFFGALSIFYSLRNQAVLQWV